MTYLISTLVSVLCIGTYLTLYLVICGLPTSVGSTFYNTEKKWLFPAVLITTIGTGAYSMLGLSPNKYRWLVFLIVGGILSAALSPAFRDEWKNKVYSLATLVAGVAGLYWLVTAQAPLYALIIYIPAAIFDKKHRILWIETGIAICIYWQLICLSVQYWINLHI